jgi:autotransporter strand-loop-strand O-heptosyltransferase
VPTQRGPLGITFDFNRGARLVLPNRTEGKWRVRLRDVDTGTILFQTENQGALLSFVKQFFVRFGIEVLELDAAGNAAEVLAHQYDAREGEIVILFPVGTKRLWARTSRRHRPP